MARISDAGLKVSNQERDNQYSAEQVRAVLEGALGGGGGGGGGTTVNRTHQMATYQTFTNPSKVYYTALETDGVTAIVERTQTGVTLVSSNYQLYGYDQPLSEGMSDWIAVWDEGDANQYTLSWEVVGGGTGIVTPPEDHGGTGLAQAVLATSQSTSSLLTVDATASTADTYAWEIDGVPRPETDAVVTYGPLTVGSHVVRLTVTVASDASFEILDTTINVAWIAEPLGDAQFDNVNSRLAPVLGTNLALWDPLPAIGPWRAKGILNMEDPDGDGIPRITIVDDNHISLLSKASDVIDGHDTLYRPNLTINTAYDGTLAGYPLGTTNLNATGNIATGGTSGETRFYRLEYMFDTTCPGGPDSPAGAGDGAPGEAFKHFNNLAETHGIVGGPGMFTAGTEVVVSPTRNAICFREQSAGGASVGTPQYFDLHTISYGTWYNYVIEYRQSLDPGVGYIRVYKDGAVLLADVPAGTDGAGRFFATTAMTDANGDYVALGFNIQNYRTYATITPTYQDAVIHYRNIRIGPSFASVYP